MKKPHLEKAVAPANVQACSSFSAKQNQQKPVKQEEDSDGPLTFSTGVFVDRVEDWLHQAEWNDWSNHIRCKGLHYNSNSMPT